MKRINLLTILVAVTLLMTSFHSAIAQSGGKKTYVEAFDDGRVLTASDIKFLNLITDGTGNKDATVGGKTYKAGQKLTVSDAAALNKAKSNYRKTHKMEKATDAKAIDKSRGTQETCYWYLYCDGYGNCYYIWYCD